jgi:ribosome recycling factor
MPINQLAKVQAPDARLIVVTPWDKSTIGDIERGIIAAGLGLNPSNDGQVIRVPVPPLTSERRRDLARQLRKTGEEAKVKMRHVRREYNELFKQGEKDGDISEDDLHRLLAKIQDLTNLEIKQVDAAMDAKEEEVMAI